MTTNAPPLSSQRRVGLAAAGAAVLAAALLGACGQSGAASPGGIADAAAAADSGDRADVSPGEEAPADDSSPPAADAATDAPADASSAGDGSDAAGPVQSLAIPMYMDPSAAGWSQERSAAPTVALVVANPDSGPGASADAAYTQAIADAHAAGQTIIGYVHTSYGARPIAQVEADIDSWYAFYPAIDGIFSDETATDAAHVPSYYAPLYAYVKGKTGRRVVVINPGTPPDESYMTASDVVMSFEDTYANYLNATPPAWVASYPRSRFWHAVLSATQAQMTSAVQLARQRNAGFVFVTDQGPSTAYQQLPAGAYWTAELAAVSAP